VPGEELEPAGLQYYVVVPSQKGAAEDCLDMNRLLLGAIGNI
jgi:hypothetical protein